MNMTRNHNQDHILAGAPATNALACNQTEQEMKSLRKSVEKYLFRFDELASKFGLWESYKAVRRHYLDICCYGDAIINELLDGLKSNDPEYFVKFLNDPDHVKNAVEIKRLIDDYLIDTIEDLERTELKLEVFIV
jgi:hypothetical protein